ncbi:histidine phosphatase family protein [Patescibacteria group bacterium]|nr:histidine phosphatase family protein [Patescibacteria group bacterium]
MSWPKLLILVRHAESVGNVTAVPAKLNLSAHQYPLTKKGIEQAKITGEYLRKNLKKFDVSFTSYYQRAIQTMELLYPQAQFTKDARLAEQQRGIWHTMTEKEIKKSYPQEIKRKQLEGLYHHRAWGGENWPDVELRIRSFLDDLKKFYHNKKVLLVVHGRWLVIFQSLITPLSIEEAIFKSRLEEAAFANSSITIYEEKTSNKKSNLVLVEENIIPWQGKL